jgi:predicted DCC family thiol-disulfide oxidoreductase YuxK
VEQGDTLFYDGHCALCHGTVRFVLARDTSHSVTRFAPLSGQLFKEQVPEARRAALPDSLVLFTADGRLLTRSAAVLHILRRLGGPWGVFAAIARIVPGPVRDFVYDVVAKIRYRVFGTRDDACPVIPASARSRFDLR